MTHQAGGWTLHRRREFPRGRICWGNLRPIRGAVTGGSGRGGHQGRERADVLVTFHDAERFVIEVKRITESATDAELSDSFGDQAGQYTLTGPPFAFLAVLDLTHWESRLPISASFWVVPWRVPTTDEMRALTGLRVLADVATPS